MVIGSMVGAGIFNLPGRFATATGPFGAIIAWVIAGTGMYMLARVFQALANKRPDIDNGVFAYAKAGFGDYMSFLSAFGYWISAILGNTFYWVLIGATLGQFFPQFFGDGTSASSIIVSLIGVWAFHFMILRGVKEATFINKVVTVAKIVPLILAVLLFIFFFNYAQFRENFFGGVGMPEKSLIMQVRDTMLITVFVFLGIEGASVYSRYAEKRSDVGSPSNCDDLLFDDVLWVDNAKRDHFDFMTKMRDRGVEVLEMHNLLAETVAVPEGKKWILDNQVTPNQVGLGLVDEVRSYLEGLKPRDLAETLIGGLSTQEFPDHVGARCWSSCATPPASPNISCRRSRTRSTPATPPAGSMAASR